MRSFAELELLVLRWAEARKIYPNSTPKAQAVKTLEEAGELLEAATAIGILKELGTPEDHPMFVLWMSKYKDACGDVLVTIINGCALADVSLTGCLNESYEEIKDRRGTMNAAGIFVKE